MYNERSKEEDNMNQEERLEKRQQRESIIQGLYAMDLTKQTYKDVLNAIKLDEWIVDCLKGIEANMEDIDDIISSHLVNWTLKRLSYVDRAILRLAVYEMKYLNLPKTIVINEAVELSKDFSEIEGMNTHAFNNKVLDNIAKSLNV